MQRAKGPHKSVHCPLCKTPGIPPLDEKPLLSMIEKTTKVRLSHEAAQLNLIENFTEVSISNKQME